MRWREGRGRDWDRRRIDESSEGPRKGRRLEGMREEIEDGEVTR